MDGWNGHVCRQPAANTYCVGDGPIVVLTEPKVLESIAHRELADVEARRERGR